MRKLISVASALLCSSVLLLSAPAATFAAPGYFQADGHSSLDGPLSHEFMVGSSGGVDITLTNRGPATWAVVSGHLPAGMVLDSVAGDALHSIGIVTGTPSEEGVFPVRLLALVGSTTYFLDYTVTTYNPTITVTPAGVAQGRVGLAYTQPLTAGGSIAIAPDLLWELSSGTLPPGVTLNSATGALSGTPSAAGDYTFSVRVTERSGHMRTATPRTYVLTVQPAVAVAPVHITTRLNPVNGRVGTTYPAQIYRAEGGSGHYQWQLASGAFPPGLSIDSTGGILQGTPTTAGTYSFELKAIDLALLSNSDSVPATMTIDAAAPSTPPSTLPPISPTVTPTPVTPGTPSVTTTTPPNGTVGADYAASLSASGGTAPYTWNFASGTLPPGLTLSASGLVSGRPTTAGTYTAYLEVFDAARLFSGRSLSFTINALPSTPTPLVPSAPPTIPTAPPTISPTPSATPTPSAELTNRLNNLARISVSVHALVKLPDDGDRSTQADSAVYYVGTDGRRHAFPNDRVFFSWYSNFDGVRVVSASDLASIPLGSNATYKPGVKMVKFTTDPKVYAVSGGRMLRWVKTEAAAIALYGTNWNRQIDDLSDSFYMDYLFGADIAGASDFDRARVQAAASFVSDTLAF